MKNNNAPIVLFVYKRLDHTRIVIDALKDNPEACDSILYIYSDAPANEEDSEDVQKVRDYIGSINGFKDVIVCERETNFGIEESEIDGITTVIEKHGRVIILEDDIQVGNQFLKYMNYCLSEYEDRSDIFSITGYSFFKTAPGNDNVFGFTRSFCAWGWATWADRWQHMSRVLDRSDISYAITHRKSMDNGQDFTCLLLHQYTHDCLTWDVAWYFSCCKNGGLTLFPFNTLINNIGMDGSGVHYNDSSKENRIEEVNNREPLSFPLVITPIQETKKKVVEEKKSANKKSAFKEFKMMIRFWLNAIKIMTVGAYYVEIR